MKTLQDVQWEIPEAEVMSIDDFRHRVISNEIDTTSGGVGFFHNGDCETNVCTFGHSLHPSEVQDFPYVCWYQ